MILRQARKRYPHVSREILCWALDNIPDQSDLERGLHRLNQAKQLRIQYGVA